MGYINFSLEQEMSKCIIDSTTVYNYYKMCNNYFE